MIYHKERLDDVHPTLAAFILTLVTQLEKHWPDWLILCGWRNQQDQHAAFLAGTSKVDWPNSKHNKTRIKLDKFYEEHTEKILLPASLAVDLSPYPYDAGKDRERLYIVAGYAMALADRLGYKIRIGADWDGDLQTIDQKLHDPWHFELVLDE
jgi:hypothetical protein